MKIIQISDVDLTETLMNISDKYDSDKKKLASDFFSSTDQDPELNHTFDVSNIADSLIAAILYDMIKNHFFKNGVICIKSFGKIEALAKETLNKHGHNNYKDIATDFVEILKKKIGVRKQNKHYLLFNPYNFIYKISFFITTLIPIFLIVMTITFQALFIYKNRNGGDSLQEYIQSALDMYAGSIANNSPNIQATFSVFIDLGLIPFCAGILATVLFWFLSKHKKDRFIRVNTSNVDKLTKYRVLKFFDESGIESLPLINIYTTTARDHLLVGYDKGLPAIIVPSNLLCWPFDKITKFSLLHELYHVINYDYKKNKLFLKFLLYLPIAYIFISCGAEISYIFINNTGDSPPWRPRGNIDFLIAIYLIYISIFWHKRNECRGDYFAANILDDFELQNYLSKKKTNFFRYLFEPNFNSRIKYIKEQLSHEISFSTLITYIIFTYIVIYLSSIGDIIDTPKSIILFSHLLVVVHLQMLSMHHDITFKQLFTVEAKLVIGFIILFFSIIIFVSPTAITDINNLIEIIITSTFLPMILFPCVVFLSHRPKINAKYIIPLIMFIMLLYYDYSDTSISSKMGFFSLLVGCGILHLFEILTRNYNQTKMRKHKSIINQE